MKFLALEWDQFVTTHKLKHTYKASGSRYDATAIYHGHQIALHSFTLTTGGRYQEQKVETSTVFIVIAIPSQEKVDVVDTYESVNQLSRAEVIDQLTVYHDFPDHAKLTASPQGHKFVLEQRGVPTLTMLENRFNFLCDLVNNYPAVLALGGQAMSALRSLAADQVDFLQPVAEQLMIDIGEETTTRLAPQAEQRLCPHCLMICTPHKASRSWWRSVTFYGCRVCQQSRTFLRGQPLAVLDQAMTEERIEKQGVVLINWLTHRQLFDFAGVYIGQTTDEVVERFSVQVGNDTDTWRKSRYAQMRCLVSSDAALSENTMRILRRTFGNVAVVDV